MAGAEAERIRSEASVRALAEAMGVEWDRRRSRPLRGDLWGCCPFHGERTPSLHVVEPGGAGGWFRCFGCGAKGSAVDFVMARDGVGAGEALRRLAGDLGLSGPLDEAARARAEARRAERAAARAADERRAEREAERRLMGAALMWRRARAGHPLLGQYLRARGVDLAAIGGVPPSLRLAEGLACWGEGQNRRKEEPLLRGPAMIGAIGRGGRLVGVHRTWITAEGRARLPDGSKAPKKWLGRTGAMEGWPVAFSPARETMLAGEGIETVLAAWGALLRRHPGAPVGAEAALSRGALARGAWRPPAGCRRVVLLAEGSSRHPREAREATAAALAAIRGRGVAAVAVLPGGDWDVDADAASVAEAMREVAA